MTEDTEAKLREYRDSIDNIDAALNTLDSLKLAELQNYFGNDCVLTVNSEESVNALSSERATAVFNSVILPDRTAIIASLPDGRRQLAWIDVDRDTLNQEINAYRWELERFFESYSPQRSRQVYDWLIRPFAEALEQALAALDENTRKQLGCEIAEMVSDETARLHLAEKSASPTGKSQ